MQSIFNITDYAAMINRIKQLNPSAQQLWGKMNPAQMLNHCQKPLEVVFGELKLKRGLVGVLFGGIAKRSMAGEKPFKRNLPTVPSFIVRNEHDFETEKEKLINLLHRFKAIDPVDLEAIVHPFFGKMSKDEWDRLNWKHLDHHLQQFGG